MSFTYVSAIWNDLKSEMLARLAGHTMDGGYTRNLRSTPAIPYPINYKEQMPVRHWMMSNDKHYHSAYLCGPNKQDATTPANVLVIPKLLDGDNINSISCAITAVSHHSDQDMFLDVKWTRIEEARLGNDLFHDLAKRERYQLYHQGCQSHCIFTIPKELVDKRKCH